MTDIAATLISKSDQLDNVDLIGGPRDFTITGVKVKAGDQPVEFTLAEFDRVWRPGLTMRRLMSHVWGTTDASTFVGRRVRLYRDPSVKFGNESPGGTRISHMSHIDKTVTVELPAKRGKSDKFVVEPLTDAPAPTTIAPSPSAEFIADVTDLDELRDMWKSANEPARELIKQRKAELEAGA